MRKLLVALSLSLFTGTGFAAVVGKEVTYKANGLTLKGYLASDDAVKGKRPGVLVVHEWWGHDDYARMRARKLAELGYTALALDMYGAGKQAHDPDHAKAMATAVSKDPAGAKARFDAAMAFLKKQPNVDAENIAAIGYCFGGSVALNMARAGEDLKGVASFHGNLSTEKPAQKGRIKGKVLVLTGADDPMAPAEQVAKFEQEMKDAGVDYRVVSYPGAKHGFTNPAADKYGKQFNMPLAYNAEADKASWDELKPFLQQVFSAPIAGDKPKAVAN